MIITRTPFRISFFGGGTDFPAWYKQHGGTVLATTIDKYCYLTTRYLPPFFEHKYRVVWSKIELGNKIDDIMHPAVPAIVKHVGIERGLEIHHVGDLPARSGMGSSSSFTVGLLNSLYALKGKMPSKVQLATETIHLEQEVLQETVGSQDQVCAAYGGFNRITFLPHGEIAVVPVTLSRDRFSELNSNLMLFYTGIVRTSSQIADSFAGDLESRKRQLRIMKDLVEEAVTILNSDCDISAFGTLLREAWDAKRSLSGAISNSHIDSMFEAAYRAGALGGKITGAGGGGFLLLFVPPANQARVKQALNKLLHVPFRFEFSGSQVIFAEPENDYKDAEVVRTTQAIEPFREVALQKQVEILR